MSSQHEFELFRKEQEAEGRRQLKAERASAEHCQERLATGQDKSRPKLAFKSKLDISPKGHEAFLKALESSGAVVSFEKISSGGVVEGVIKHSDKYTISVLSKGQTRVLFKHDISEFWTAANRTNAVS